MDGDRGPEPISPNCSNYESNQQAGSLKKARIPWQVNGDGRNGIQRKIAEKNQRVGSSTNNNNEERCPDVQEPHCSTSAITVSDSNPVQVLAEIDANSDSPCSHYRQHVMEVDCGSSSSGSRAVQRQMDHDAEESIARPPVHPALRRWQSKQLAQGIIDNSINKVLGDLSLPPFQNEGPPGWGNYLNPLNIENEGVVEAIRQQGLQRRYSQRPSEPTSPRPTDVTCHKRLRVSDEQEGAGTSSSTSDCHVDSTSQIVEAAPVAHSSNETEPALHKNEVDTGHQSTEIVPNDTSTAAADTILMPPEELLNTAISCAITHKGLGVLPVNE